MGNSWRFTRADWHAIMEDISEYNRKLAEAQYGLHDPWTS